MAEMQTVWVIDDEADILEMCEGLLAPHFQVRGFESAEPVLQALEKGELPNVFVTDINMPGMDGLKFTEHLRARRIESPVIMVSGYADKAMAVKALGLGVFSLLDKPFQPAQYVHAVRKAAAHGSLFELTEELLSQYSKMVLAMEDLLQKSRDRYITAENRLPDGPIPNNDKRQALEFMKQVVAESKIEDIVTQARGEIRSALKKRDALRSARLRAVSGEVSPKIAL